MLAWVWGNTCSLEVISLEDNLLVSVKTAKSHAIYLNNPLHGSLSYIYPCIYVQSHRFETIYCIMVNSKRLKRASPTVSGD